MIIFTSICANYLHKARTLAKSVKKWIPETRFIVCLVEREVKPEYGFQYFDEIVKAEDAWEGNFNQFIYKHSIVEASTSVKGQFFRYLYKRYPEEKKLIYLDPDIYVYDDFIELKALLEDRPIILCPHLLQPGNIDMELSSTAHGVYNLGFLAVNNSEEAKRFINWWADRLYLFCYDDIQKGIFTDQKWIDLAPCFFETHILKHHGYDFGTWSLFECEMTKDGDTYRVHGDPLRFIHFSGYGQVIEKCIKDWLPQGDHLFKDLYSSYCQEHEINNKDNISKSDWSYGYYVSGEKINDQMRVQYRRNYDVMFSIENPFAMSNLKIHHLLSDNPIKTKSKWEKAIEIAKEDGFLALCQKAIMKSGQIFKR